MVYRAKVISDLVTTIIPVYNRPTMLVDAVKSVLAQSYSSIEIIIINDGSTDNTLNIAEQLKQSHECIKIVSIENSGPAIAREHGRQLANGEFIQYLDSDDLLHKEKFRKQVTVLKKNAGIGVAYCIQELCDDHGNIVDPAWMRSAETFKTMFPAMLGGRIWGTPVPLYRATLLEKAGPWLNLSNQEDWEYDCRIASLNVKLHHCSETLVTIRQHNGDHLGQVGENKQKFIDKATSYLEIYKHALSAQIDKKNVESIRFNRMTFMLARQCASKGLIPQSKKLMEICNEGTASVKRKVEYKLYSVLSTFFGWQNIAKLTTYADRIFR